MNRFDIADREAKALPREDRADFWRELYRQEVASSHPEDKFECRIAEQYGLGPQKTRILASLVQAGGDVVPHRRLNHLLGCALDSDAQQVLRTTISYLRKKTGYKIVSVSQRGYRIQCDAPKISQT